MSAEINPVMAALFAGPAEVAQKQAPAPQIRGWKPGAYRMSNQGGQSVPLSAATLLVKSCYIFCPDDGVVTVGVWVSLPGVARTTGTPVGTIQIDPGRGLELYVERDDEIIDLNQIQMGSQDTTVQSYVDVSYWQAAY